MASNNPLNNPYGQQAMAGTAVGTITGLGGIVGPGQWTTTTVPYPAQIYNPYSTPADPFPFPSPYVAMNFIGHFRIRQLENGYLVEYQIKEGDRMREYFAEDLKDAGERITALCVEKTLRGETPK